MILNGKSISRQIAIEEVLVYKTFSYERSIRKYEDEDTAEMQKQYNRTKELALKELNALEARLKQRGSDHADFVQAHREILCDIVMDKEIVKLISEKKLYPDSAITETYDKYIGVFSKNKNKLIQERAADLRDVLTRLLRCWHGVPEKTLSSLERPCIIVAEELLPTDTLSLDEKNIKGIITEKGGLTSHTAIIARSLDIPALLGVADVLEYVNDKERIILDGINGKVIISPTEEEIEEYQKQILKVEKEREITRQYMQKESVTKEGTKIDLRVNIASADIHHKEQIPYIDGVGLFRSEFLYLTQDEMPSEEYQFQAYKTVLQVFDEKPVVLRTLDIGGDKHVEYMKLPTEENPFLGNRGVRLCLANRDLFRSQIRAALRASAYGILEIMFPMVTSVNEFREAKELVMEVGKELDSENIEWDHDVMIGIMIETPAIALIADLIVDEIDFASVGTNDLTQYLCAADRMNADVKAYYQDYHPAIFRCLASLAETFQKAGKCLSICGELAGDPLAIPVLVGIGIRTLSQSLTSIAHSKQIIRNIDMEQAKELAVEVQQMKSDKDVLKCLKIFAENLSD
ncbi:MAG: phosphoenolpyruvate--protein phosphotransferase [Hespellia sp.]|nr:phosphoenolpyruvate--protein phosphotransferase [Hespellia sp.]